MILGIDQGLANCGYALIDKEHDKYKVKDMGFIETSSQLDVQQRLLIIFNKLLQIINNNKIDLIVTENLHVGGGSNKAIVTVNMVTGMIYLLGGLNNIDVIEAVPTSVKKKITNNGKATKEELFEYIKNITIIPDNKKINNHVSDAIAIGIYGNIKLKEQEVKLEYTKKLSELILSNNYNFLPLFLRMLKEDETYAIKTLSIVYKENNTNIIVLNNLLLILKHLKDKQINKTIKDILKEISESEDVKVQNCLIEFIKETKNPIFKTYICKISAKTKDKNRKAEIKGIIKLLS